MATYPHLSGAAGLGTMLMYTSSYKQYLIPLYPTQLSIIRNISGIHAHGASNKSVTVIKYEVRLKARLLVCRPRLHVGHPPGMDHTAVGQSGMPSTHGDKRRKEQPHFSPAPI